MSDTNETAESPAKEKRIPITESFYHKADGKEADSPLDSVTKFTFRLVAADKSWDVDYSTFRAAAELAGIPANEVNTRIAFDSFGVKTKLNNIANSVRNSPKFKGTDAAGPTAQADAVSEFLAELEKGNWRGEAGEFVAGVADLAQAVFNVQTKAGKSPDLAAISAKLEAMTGEERKPFRNRPDVQAELAEIQAARKRAKVAATPLPDLDL
jgi:hypothetical protein